MLRGFYGVRSKKNIFQSSKEWASTAAPWHGSITNAYYLIWSKIKKSNPASTLRCGGDVDLCNLFHVWTWPHSLLNTLFFSILRIPATPNHSSLFFLSLFHPLSLSFQITPRRTSSSQDLYHVEYILPTRYIFSLQFYLMLLLQGMKSFMVLGNSKWVELFIDYSWLILVGYD